MCYDSLFINNACSFKFDSNVAEVLSCTPRGKTERKFCWDVSTFFRLPRVLSKAAVGFVWLNSLDNYINVEDFCKLKSNIWLRRDQETPFWIVHLGDQLPQMLTKHAYHFLIKTLGGRGKCMCRRKIRFACFLSHIRHYKILHNCSLASKLRNLRDFLTKPEFDVLHCAT